MSCLMAYKGEERRYFKRVAVPGAKVSYAQRKGFHNSDELSGTAPLADITQMSVRFETAQTLHPGAYIEIEIMPPGKEKILAKGNIVWVSDPAAGKPGYAVVQFLPFGTDERYNPLNSLQQLKELTQQYLKD